MRIDLKKIKSFTSYIGVIIAKAKSACNRNDDLSLLWGKKHTVGVRERQPVPVVVYYVGLVWDP